MWRELYGYRQYGSSSTLLSDRLGIFSNKIKCYLSHAPNTYCSCLSSPHRSTYVVRGYRDMGSGVNLGLHVTVMLGWGMAMMYCIADHSF